MRKTRTQLYNGGKIKARLKSKKIRKFENLSIDLCKDYTYNRKELHE